MKTVKDIYKELIKTLKSTEPELEAEIILETILGISKIDLITKSEKSISQNNIKKILEIRDKRARDKTPLAYILEEAPFMDMKLFVNSDVLIPRPETELIVEQVLNEIKLRRISKPRIIDIGTGSGCIAIALKRALPAAEIFASDISKNALSVAAINAKRYKVKINFVLGDFLDPFIEESFKSKIAVPILKGNPPYFDVIVSNPPYISEEDYKNLEPELFHEPKHALVGFPYEHIIKQAKGLIKENGFIAFEFGEGQANKLQKLLPKSKVYRDLAHIERYLIADL